MAAANPRQLADRFGDQVTFWTDDVHVYMQRNDEDPVNVFDQSVADSPIAPAIEDTGRLLITYLDSSGDRHTQYSDRDGDSGTWSSL
jgi:hypothetical protein